MSPPLDELYLQWLYNQVAIDGRDKTQTYWKLFKQLYTKEFLWIIPNDDNRLEDGKALRSQFLEKQGVHVHDVDSNWMGIECSFLELMVGLAIRLEHEAGGKPHYWFWMLLDNIGLIQYNDAVRHYPRKHINEILDVIIFRQYSRHGHGGFFPLRGPCEDQRNVELWYQLCEYVLEQS